jgi:acyl carrier protein
MNELERQIATLIVEELRLDVAVDSIDPAARLYGEGLGLDSIDVLEIALVISQRYGVQLRSDDVANKHIFSSLGALANYVAQARTR